MELTPEILKKLSAPFPASAISIKVQTKPNDKGNALCVAYIDARDVMDRLDEVVGGEWSDDYRVGPAGGLECALTVCGVTRRDVGDEDNTNAKDNKEKAGYSDAFKRAAVKFGIGRFLYNLPKLYGKVKPVGNNFYLADGEEDRLKATLISALRGYAPKPEAQKQVVSKQAAPSNSEPKPAVNPAPVIDAEKRKLLVNAAKSEWITAALAAGIMKDAKDAEGARALKDLLGDTYDALAEVHGAAVTAVKEKGLEMIAASSEGWGIRSAVVRG